METIGGFIRSEVVHARLSAVLSHAGFAYQHFSSENALLRTVGRRNFDLLLFDIGDDLAGTEQFVSWMNCRSGDSTPVIALSGGVGAEFCAVALDAGANDFLHARFEPVESVARIRAVLRRSGVRPASRHIVFGGFALDREASRITYEGEAILLTPREFTMAWLFFSSPGVYISRNTIGSAIWSADSEIAGRTIEQHVYKLRKKLQLGIERNVMIRTAYSQGYRLEVPTA